MSSLGDGDEPNWRADSRINPLDQDSDGDSLDPDAGAVPAKQPARRDELGTPFTLPAPVEKSPRAAESLPARARDCSVKAARATRPTSRTFAFYTSRQEVDVNG